MNNSITELVRSSKKIVVLLTAALVVSGFFVANNVLAAAVVTPAGGGANISIDTTSAPGGSGFFTPLEGPAITETAAGDIAAGSHTIMLPPGWGFDTSSNITVSKIGNIVLGSTSITPTQTSFTFIVDSQSTSASVLMFSGLKVMPIGTTPSSGNMTYSGNGIAGVTGGEGGTNFGTLTSVPGTVTKLAFTTQPGGAVYGSLLNPQPVVKTQDQFGNDSISGLPFSLNVILALIGSGELQGTVPLDIGTGMGKGIVTFTDLKVGGVGAVGTKQLTASVDLLAPAVSSNFEISQKPLTAMVTVNNKPYDGNNSAVITGVVLNDVEDGDDVTAVFTAATATFEDANAGTGKAVNVTGITLTGADKDNYTYDGTAEGTADIAPLGITGSFTVENKVYDGTTAATVSSRSLTGVLLQDEGDVTLIGGTASFADPNIGEGIQVTASGMTLDGSKAGNYSLISVDSTTANITKAPLTITADDQEKEYGDANPALTASYAGFVGGENESVLDIPVALGTIADETSPVGDYAITASGAVDNNYEITHVNGTLTVESAPIDITPNEEQGKIYGELDEEITYTAIGFKNSEDESIFTGELGREEGEDADEYLIDEGTLDVGDNYFIYSFFDVYYTIEQRELTVTAVTDTKIYDGTTDSVGLPTIIGELQFGDTPGFTQSYDIKDVGTDKTLTPSGVVIDGNPVLEGSNYDVTFTAVSTGEITEAPLTATVTVEKKVVDGTTDATILGVELNGVIPDDDVTVLDKGTATFADSTVGTHAVTATGVTIEGADVGNYDFNGEATGTGEILPVPTNVYVDDDWAGKDAWDDMDDPATYFGYDAFATIQEGIDAVDVGGTVNVNAGTYVEDLWFQGVDNLELISTEGATIKGATLVDDALTYYAEEPNIMILSDGIKIHGFTIESMDSEEGFHPVGITIGASNVEIYDNAFKVAVGSAYGVAIVTYCDDTFCDSGPFNNGVDISGLVIRDNTFDSLLGNGRYQGIYINPDMGTGQITIQGNDFGGAVRAAISVERSGALINSNTIETSLGIEDANRGITLVNWYDQDITDVAISNNVIDGFMEGIRLAHSGETWSPTGGLADISISNNEIRNNSTGVYVYRSANGVLLSDKNVFNGNTVAVQNDDGANTLNAIENYWGTAVEATINGMTAGNVSFVPYYVDLGMEILNTDAVNEVSVDATYTDGDSGEYYFGYDAFSTIQEGIDAVADGGMVNVAAGEYSAFEVAGRSNLSIIGEGATVIDAADAELYGPNDRTMALIENSTNINITGIDFNGTGISGAGMLSGICYIDSTGNIDDLTVSNITDAEIAIGICAMSDTLDTMVVNISDVNINSSIVGIFIWDAEVNIDYSTITGIDLVEGGTGIMAIDGAVVSVENSEISNYWIVNPELGTAGLGVMIGMPSEYEEELGIEDESLSTLEMTSSTISGNNLGIYIDEDGDLIAHLNKIIGNDVLGVFKETLPSVDATANWWGISVPDFDTIVSDNVNYDPWYLDEDMQILSSDIGRADIYVDGDYTEDIPEEGLYFGLNAFATIQEGIDAVDENGTVNVAAGTYNEDIQIAKPLTLQSTNGAASTIIQGSGVGSSYYMVRIYSSDVTFDGFTVTNPNYQGGADASGILVGDYLGATGISNIQILNNTITAIRDGDSGTPSMYGATAINIGKGPINNVTISGNNITDIKNPNGAAEDHTCGINVWDDASNVVISNNNISNIKYNGILLQRANGVQITGNTITGNPTGIKINPWDGVTVSGLSISGNKIVDNTSNLENTMATQVSAEKNWWGITDGTVIPSKIVGTVDYRPWCTEETCEFIDETLPFISSHIPSTNAVGVNPFSDVEVVFSENTQCNAGEGDWAGCIAFNPAQEGTVDYDSDSYTLTFTPTDSFDSNTNYEATVSNVEDISGNLLTGNTIWRFTTANQYSIPISAGWNLISIPTVPISTNIDEVLGETAGAIDSVWTYDAVDDEWSVYHPDGPEQSNLYSMTAGYGYWISATGNSTIEGYGNLFSEQQTPPQRQLTAGWNLIGYYQKEGITSVPANYALSTLSDNYCSLNTKYWTSLVGYDNSGKTFTGADWNSNMNPNDAYWIFMKSSSIGTYMYGPGESEQSCE